MSRRRLLSAAAGVAAWSALVFVLAACGSTKTSEKPARPGWKQRGLASWYGEPFHGRATASGEIFDMNQISAAHKTLPLGTRVRVENLENGRRIEVRINDRGPFRRGRVIDLSYAAAQELDMVRAGVVPVRLVVVDASPVGDARRTLQVGAFEDRDRALNLARRLERRFPGVTVRAYGGLHRVQVDVKNRKELQKVRRKLDRRGYSAIPVSPPVST